ncbi:uncharacterized protein MYCFIDRAFT_193214 [Pseudocercospora fijiensis CIRAD86]|uniref:Uncharacterized protein n=1 Tax=Pseudocercospora fijiensis (strain CIRAD86) TaxID=383855 RepID=N1QCR0_PSEFD|nr:uncharacterized protein MYCFIDRAFT_193214 [Pseudocercospora fijiensis CIRAD86]EME89248.1 hypothetical protein MYCFIDRAFT_193214 [Pseudocercospora fijiensis CIRAD86]
MSSDRNTNSNNSRPLKPTLASTRTAAPRTPLTPRIAGTTTGSATATSTTASRPTPRLPNRGAGYPQGTPVKDAAGGNVTPRSSARKSRVGGASPAQDEYGKEALPVGGRPLAEGQGRGSGVSSLSLPLARTSRPNSVVNDNGARGLPSPLVMRSPAFADSTESIESRFFHASEAAKQESMPKKPELRKTPTFFYADGQEDKSGKPISPVLSAVNDQRPGPFIKPEAYQSIPKSPLVPSPALSNVSTSCFPPTLSNQLRSPSPSKENIHLSYRKGVSQIFGTRPVTTASPAPSDSQVESTADGNRRPSYGVQHRKSTSLSSITSTSKARRRSNTSLDVNPSPLPQAPEHTAAKVTSKTASSHIELTSIEPLASPALIGSPSELALSPTKSVSQLAADARRERKVLDLEISNSSLMAINTSLEREVRRQKAELKRFRRLSRAGRFSLAPSERSPRRQSEGLSTLSEDDEDADLSGLLSSLAEDDGSDSEDEDSLLSSSEPLSPTSQHSRQQDRLAKDEKRLQVDLQRHKELLVQSQAMNQSIKRCMYATEDMISEGKKALQYHVRVSDVKLGGRILTGFEAEEEDADDIEVADELDWHSGDRDSGVEVESIDAGRFAEATNTSERPGRPPDAVS